MGFEKIFLIREFLSNLRFCFYIFIKVVILFGMSKKSKGCNESYTNILQEFILCWYQKTPTNFCND